MIVTYLPETGELHGIVGCPPRGTVDENREQYPVWSPSVTYPTPTRRSPVRTREENLLCIIIIHQSVFLTMGPVEDGDADDGVGVLQVDVPPGSVTRPGVRDGTLGCTQNTVHGQTGAHLFVGNGGLGNGVCRERLEQTFRGHGTIVDIVLKEKKPYAFISFETAEEARGACGALQGNVVRESTGPTDPDVRLCLTFIESVPGFEMPSQEIPPGLVILPDFVTEEEEDLLLQSIDWDSADHNILQASKANLKHRRVKHYGYEFIYGVNNVDRRRPLELDIPTSCDHVIRRMMETGHVTERPDQLTVNQYEPGHGIPPHVDTHSTFVDWIAALSLGSQCVMDFRHPDGRHAPVLLPRRCLTVMTGESRHLWTHGITPRKSDIIPVTTQPANQSADGQPSTNQRLTLLPRDTRVSLTFRKLRDGPCQCAYPAQCDSQQSVCDKGKPAIKETPKGMQHIPQSEGDASKLEDSHVHQVYEEIATHFSDTRHTPWPQVVEFLKNSPEGALVADIGCGNGKYLAVNENTIKLGSDRSQRLCEICRERGHQVFVCDILAVPLRPDTFDRVICIAVIHHLSTEERRLGAVAELVKVLTPGGRALIYVWALEQERKSKKSNYLSQTKIKHKQSEPSHSPRDADDGDTGSSSEHPMDSDTLTVHVNRTHFESQDLLVPWHLRREAENAESSSQSDMSCEKEGQTAASSVYHRYYHVFRERELEQLCLKLPQVTLIESYYDKGNWCVIIEKK